jgi:hypothetical protein
MNVAAIAARERCRMTQNNESWLEYQRKRWMRPDAERWLQPDQRRWFTPEGYERKFGSRRETASPREAARERAFDRELLALRRDHAALRRAFEEVKLALLLRKAGFNQSQPRVPRGNPDGGEWTSEGGGSGLGRVRLAGSDKPRLGRGSLLAIASEFAQRAIEAYRSENGLFDLFRGRTGTVAMTTIDGEHIFGSNSTSPTISRRDRREMESLRSSLLQKYPEELETENIGRRPNDALFHAETNVLLRAARTKGGTLSGRSLEVHVDQPMCPSCRRLLPLVGLELGNPVVTFIDRSGAARTMKDGRWIN